MKVFSIMFYVKISFQIALQLVRGYLEFTVGPEHLDEFQIVYELFVLF